MKQVTRVVLDITWNDENTDHPANWDWHSMIVSEPDEEVTLVSAD